jgi:hypothetical protein
MTLSSAVATSTGPHFLSLQSLSRFQAQGSFGASHAFTLVRRNEMKTFQKLTVLMSTLCLLSAIPAIAQIETKLTFQAPFTFYAGNAKLPAGSYTVTQPEDNADLLLIQSADGSHSVLVEYLADASDTAPSTTEVTFNKYANAEFLSRISVQGQNSMQVLASKAEQNAAKTAASEKHSLSAGNGR